jgi:hypothetical protein
MSNELGVIPLQFKYDTNTLVGNNAVPLWEIYMYQSFGEMVLGVIILPIFPSP